MPSIVCGTNVADRAVPRANAQGTRKRGAVRHDGVIFAALAARIDVSLDEIGQEVCGQIASEKRVVQLAAAHGDDACACT
jgi:hypothetical protein